MAEMRRLNLAAEPTTEQRYRDAAGAERTLVQMLGVPGARPYDVTDEINAAEARAQLFEALADERMHARLAGALPTRPHPFTGGPPA